MTADRIAELRALSQRTGSYEVATARGYTLEVLDELERLQFRNAARLAQPFISLVACPDCNHDRNEKTRV